MTPGQAAEKIATLEQTNINLLTVMVAAAEVLAMHPEISGQHKNLMRHLSLGVAAMYPSYEPGRFQRDQERAERIEMDRRKLSKRAEILAWLCEDAGQEVFVRLAALDDPSKREEEIERAKSNWHDSQMMNYEARDQHDCEAGQ